MTTIVLFGGPSDERHVSVASAQNFVRSLGRPLAWFWAPNGAVHDVAIDDLLAHQRPFEVDYVPARPAIFPNLEQALDTLPVENPLFLLALHGTGGEDGTLQEMFERRGIPFTGSGSAASAAAFDKGRAKERVSQKVPVAESRIARDGSAVRDVIEDMLSRYERIVLKPLAGGSSRGLYFLGRDDHRAGVAAKVAAAGIPYIVEQFISGRELTVGVIDQGQGPMALPVIEIEVDPGREFDYLGNGTREVCPANIPPEMTRQAQSIALAAHTALGCEGYSRTDIIAAGDGLYFLELNTLPGMTNASLVPQELREAGIAFREFLEGQMALASRRAAAILSA